MYKRNQVNQGNKMKNDKLVNVLLDDETHRKFKACLRKRGKGERVKYVLGDSANKAMLRMIAKSK